MTRFSRRQFLSLFFWFAYLLLVFYLVAGSVARLLHYEAPFTSLGLYHQLVWHLSRGRQPTSTLAGTDNYFLAEDFSPGLWLVAFTYRFLPSFYLLMIWQWAMTAVVGALGLWKLIRSLVSQKSVAYLLFLAWAISLGTQQALAGDFQAAHLAANLYPWVLYWVEKRRLSWAVWLSLLALLFSPEAVVFLVAIGLFFGLRTRFRRSGLVILALASLWLLVLTKVGGRALEVGPASWEGWRYFFLSSAGLGLISPVPVLLLWGNLTSWVGVEFCLYAGVAYFLLFISARWPKVTTTRVPLKAALVVFCFTALLSLGDSSFRRSLAPGRGFWLHASRDKAVAKALAMIPPQASVAAQDIFLPPLSSRSKIYHLSNLADAQYVVFTTPDLASPKAWRDFYEQLRVDRRYVVIFQSEKVILFCRAQVGPC